VGGEREKKSDGASFQEKVASSICTRTKNRPEVGLQRGSDLSTMSNGSTPSFVKATTAEKIKQLHPFYERMYEVATT
jgi:hypothetical protein